MLYCAVALEILVENHITGLPVVDGDSTVVGIISDFRSSCLGRCQ